ncbi:sulfite exporter TauE/SafE family protein [Engelhardtia mirabilis]|uniref:Probable membrane transporter protein n=1 Tax=Engelhardtia mirabilis TaxID=2528011 RepID=A0A518BPL3_9BACT|nr:Sulfite exporter TauE/SafE [Planctomycetes bacterium Pla133]QDV03248.1 Sulfite exporter TauE/SafE [Planctomycetes bacterium Pla86]
MSEGERDAALHDPAGGPSKLWLTPAAAAIAVLGSMAGIGGGLFTGPLLAIVYGFALRRAVATALGVVLVNALLSTATEMANPDGRILWGVAAAMAAGALLGAQIGIHVARRLDERRLRQVFVVVLALAGTRVVVDACSNGASVAEGSGAIAPIGYAIALIAGLLGGTASPVLGIGGGLVMVPTVYLLLPGAGFAEARACSLAVIVVTAARSLWLHARDGRVSWACVAWLAPGAALGGVVGARLVHRDGLDLVGQVILGLVLWLVAVLFTIQLRRSRRTA